jgi:hypothetical protein
MILLAVLVCMVSCVKRNTENIADDNGDVEEAGVTQTLNLYTEDEIKSLPREELMRNAGKIFYVIADVPMSEFCRRAVVFTEDKNGVTIYLSIDGSVIRDRLGTVLIDGSEYGGMFYAWKIEVNKKNDNVFFIYCYWKSHGFDASSTDPLSMKYDTEKDLIYIWHIDPKDL